MNSNNLSRTIENEHDAKKVEVSKRINSISTGFFEESNQPIRSSLKEHIELLEEINKTLPELEIVCQFINDFGIEDIINMNQEEEFLSDKLTEELSSLQAVSKGILFETLDIRNNRLTPLLSVLSILLRKRLNRSRISERNDLIYKLLKSLPRVDSEEPATCALEIITSLLEDDQVKNKISEIAISDVAIEALEIARIFPLCIIIDPTLEIMKAAMSTKAGKAKLIRNGVLQFLIFYADETDKAEDLLYVLLKESEIIADNATEDIPAMLRGRTFRNKGLNALTASLTTTRESAPQRFGFKRIYL